MKCVNCGSEKENQVLETRARNDYIYRRRKCLACGFEYVTHETFYAPAATKGRAKILYMTDAVLWNDAVWLEFKSGKLIATSITIVDESKVWFDNGITASKSEYLHKWRMWTKKPSDKAMGATPWLV